MKNLLLTLFISIFLIGCVAPSVTISDGTKQRTIKINDDVKIQNDSIFFKSKGGTPYYLPLNRYDYSIAKNKR